MIKESQNILVTGGRGFIGVNLIKLLGENRRVKVYDSLERSSRSGWVECSAEMLLGNVLDETTLKAAMQGSTSVSVGSVVVLALSRTVLSQTVSWLHLVQTSCCCTCFWLPSQTATDFLFTAATRFARCLTCHTSIIARPETG